MPAGETTLETSAMRKIGWRIVPFLALLYFAAFIDRANISFAAPTMNRELGFSPYVYGLGAGVFFIGYVLFEIPSNLILHRVGARRWIARIMVTWAVVAAAMALLIGPKGFYLTRFLLGVAEAGFFPGVVYYLTRWAPAGQRARLIGLFMTAIPVSTALGGPLSSAILTLDGLLGLSGWRWLFLLEAIPSLILGVAVLFALPDTPDDAPWLSSEEKAWLARTLETEASRRPRRDDHSLAGLTDPSVILLGAGYFGVEIGLYGVILWIPQILAAVGIPAPMAGYVTAIPYAIAAVAMVWWCRRSDRARERPWHIAGAATAGALGLAASALLVHAPALSVAAITLGAAGTMAVLPIFWTLPAARLKGAAAAGGIALINAVGNLGGFVGPYAVGWIKDVTGNFTYGLLVLAGAVLATGIAALIVGHDSAVEHGEPTPAPAPAT
jgi:ACS family tartrate transporter-like MFS transporter